MGIRTLQWTHNVESYHLHTVTDAMLLKCFNSRIAMSRVQTKLAAISWEWGRNEFLSSVFPHEQSATHVHVERTNQSLLRNFHACVQQLNQLHWQTLLFVPEIERPLNIFVVIKYFFGFLPQQKKGFLGEAEVGETLAVVRLLSPDQRVAFHISHLPQVTAKVVGFYLPIDH